jgi:hypothetical protein
VKGQKSGGYTGRSVGLAAAIPALDSTVCKDSLDSWLGASSFFFLSGVGSPSSKVPEEGKRVKGR